MQPLAPTPTAAAARTTLPAQETTEGPAELIERFHESHLDSFHDQRVIAAVIGCSKEKLERDRWAGKGLPYVKFGRLVRYQKRAVLEPAKQPA